MHNLREIDYQPHRFTDYKNIGYLESIEYGYEGVHLYTVLCVSELDIPAFILRHEFQLSYQLRIENIGTVGIEIMQSDPERFAMAFSFSENGLYYNGMIEIIIFNDQLQLNDIPEEERVRNLLKGLFDSADNSQIESNHLKMRPPLCHGLRLVYPRANSVLYSLLFSCAFFGIMKISEETLWKNL